MSVTDPATEPVQPEEGQGGGGESAGDPPYADYLNRVPEEVRGDVAPVFHDWNSSVNRKFEEHAEYRKGWEPYEPLGINQRSPEEVQWALQLSQLAQQDPQGFQEWFQGYAQEHNLTPQEQAAQAADAPSLDEFFSGDPQQIQGLLDQRLSPLQQQLEQMNQRFEQQEFAAREAQARQYIDGQVAELRDQHLESLPKDLRDKFESIVETHAARYIESDPANAVTRGWADFEALMNQLQTAALQQKVNQPAPAESGGVPALESDAPKSLKEAEAVARQQLRANFAA